MLLSNAEVWTQLKSTGPATPRAVAAALFARHPRLSAVSTLRLEQLVRRVQRFVGTRLRDCDNSYEKFEERHGAWLGKKRSLELGVARRKGLNKKRKTTTTTTTTKKTKTTTIPPTSSSSSSDLERLFSIVAAAVGAAGEALTWETEKDAVGDRVIVRRRRASSADRRWKFEIDAVKTEVVDDDEDDDDENDDEEEEALKYQFEARNSFSEAEKDAAQLRSEEPDVKPEIAPESTSNDEGNKESILREHSLLSAESDFRLGLGSDDDDDDDDDVDDEDDSFSPLSPPPLRRQRANADDPLEDFSLRRCDVRLVRIEEEIDGRKSIDRRPAGVSNGAAKMETGVALPSLKTENRRGLAPSDPTWDPASAKHGFKSKGVGAPRKYPKIERDEKGEYRCHVVGCKVAHARFEYLISHFKTFHRLFTLACPSCPADFLHPNTLLLHEDSRHSPPDARLHPCPLCPRRFTTSHNLALHRDLDHVKWAIRCEFCEAEVEKAKEAGEEGTVEGAGETFEATFQKNRHIYENHGDKVYLCHLCAARPIPFRRRCHFEREAVFVRHAVTRHGGKGLSVCRWCSSRFGSPADLSYHVEFRHPEEVVLPPDHVICDVVTCQLPFSTAYNLARHQEWQHKKGKTVGRNGVTRKSKEEEEEIKKKTKTMCEECGATVDDLLRHARDHHAEGDGATPSKPFKCLKCGEAFREKEALRKHRMNRHSGRVLRCPQCPGKIFSQPSTLKQHIRGIHGGESFACPLCPKVYSIKFDLRSHVEAAHEGKRWPCCVCGKEFSRPNEKHRHEKRVHGLVSTRKRGRKKGGREEREGWLERIVKGGRVDSEINGDSLLDRIEKSREGEREMNGETLLDRIEKGLGVD